MLAPTRPSMGERLQFFAERSLNSSPQMGEWSDRGLCSRGEGSSV
jgi:hypothetical protein